MTSHTPQLEINWLRAGAITVVIGIVTFSTGYGARSQTVNEHERRIAGLEKESVPRTEYQVIIRQNQMMLDKIDSLQKEVTDFRIEQARLHGKQR